MSAVKNAALTVAADTTPKAARRFGNAQTTLVQHLAFLWNGLDGDARSQWQAAAQQMRSPDTLGLKPAMNAFNCYVALNTGIVNTGGEPLSTPITDRPNALPAFSLSYSDLSSVESLVLSTPAGYTGKVLLWASAPVLVGANQFDDRLYKQIGTLDSLTANTDLNPLYLAKYRVPAAGYKVMVKIVGISPGGYRTNPAYLSAITVAPSASSPVLTLG